MQVLFQLNSTSSGYLSDLISPKGKTQLRNCHKECNMNVIMTILNTYILICTGFPKKVGQAVHH